MQTEKIRVRDYSLARLVQQIEQGTLRIPRFQREFTWDRARVRNLFDSMVKEYPIGTLFFWEAPAKYNHFLREVEALQQPPLEQQKSYTLIIDGQQRLTSIYAVIKGLTVDDEDFGRLAIDLSVDNAHEQDMFSFRDPDNMRWVAVRDLLDTNPFEIYERLSQQKYKLRFQQCLNLLQNYPFSVVEVSNMGLRETVEIFERINQQGKRLSRYDLIAASVMTKDFDLREKTETDLLERLPLEFSDLSETNIPQALALNIRNSTEFQVQMNLQTQDIQKVWDETIECLLLSVDFVSSRYRALRLEFVPYEAMLPVLQHLFFVAGDQINGSAQTLEQVDHWFWQAAFGNRYSGASQTAMTSDAASFREYINTQRGFNLPLTLTHRALANGSMRATTSAVRNGILCLLSLRDPRRFDTGETFRISGPGFERFTRAENHHIFPSGFLKLQNFKTKDVHWIPNFSFIPSEISKKIGDTPPSQYMADFRKQLGDMRFAEVMHSHLIPVESDSGIWIDDYNLFLNQRAALLLREVQQLCGAAVPIDERKRNSSIDLIEVGLRNKIHETLMSAEGSEYWGTCIQSIDGGSIHGNIQKRIVSHVKKNPDLSLDAFRKDLRAKWDFADVSDYERVIGNKVNWKHFADIFRSKPVFQQNLSDFREYRNRVKHNRQVGEIFELRGKAAVLWLASALKVDLKEIRDF